MLEVYLQECFDFFSIKLSGNVCRVKTEITGFEKLLAKQQDLEPLGEWFCWNYVAFQFEYYAGLKTQMNGRYPANWIFGKKALERWNSRGENWQYFVQKFLTDHDIQLPIQYHQENLETWFEEQRRKFLNTDRGLYHCLQFARYSAKSATCLICNNKKDCKELWK